ncbi:MFS general substrate transporter [Thozetella sp. PMI_491]|nr:MFS general substrate transporter [Thozetella sp. PMI_491]
MPAAHVQKSAQSPVSSEVYDIARPSHLKGLKLSLVITAITSVTFLMLLDTSIMSTAIPKITDEFHSLSDVGWYGSAYLLAFSVMQLLSGKLYNKFRTKWTYLCLFGLFELGSLLCGVATSSQMLIVGRAVAGLGGAGLINGAMTIIGTTVPLHKQPALIGVLMGVAETGVVCGPLVGGAFTGYTTWRWCFYVNLPLGTIVALYLFFVSIPDQIVKAPPLTVLANIHLELDLGGFVLFSGAVIQLLLALQYGGATLPWDSAIVIGLLVGSVATFAVFTEWIRRLGDKSLVPISIVSRQAVWASALTALLIMTTQIITAYYLPIYFQAVRNASPFESGVDILPAILGQLLGAVFGGVSMQKIGYAIPFAILGAVLATIGTGLFTLFTPNTPTSMWIGFEVLQGLGRGFAVQAPLVSIQAQCEASEISTGTSLVMFAQTLGNAIFLTVANTVFDAGLRSTLPKHAPLVNTEEIIALGATGFQAVLPPDQLPGVLEAFSQSLDRVFYIGIATAALGIVSCLFMGWVDLREKRPVPNSGAELRSQD